MFDARLITWGYSGSHWSNNDPCDAVEPVPRCVGSTLCPVLGNGVAVAPMRTRLMTSLKEGREVTYCQKLPQTDVDPFSRSL
jgi:hypothetical protein